ncbi:MAG: Na/Pi symporter [Bacteroidota bacterium]
MKIVLYILGALVLFLFALDLMISSLQHLGKNVVETIILATANPFTALFIGLLSTAMIQSSSTTTSMVVALVASGSLTLQSALPIIMGANVGTTITSTIVSLGFINKKKEFRRAVAAGTYHCFFNLLTVIILFPLEYYYGFLSSMSSLIANYFLTPAGASAQQNEVSHLWLGFDPVISFLTENISSGFVLIILSFALLFGSILLFRKLISDLLEAKSPELFSRFFFKNQPKSFVWGLLTTAAIRSSTITTSVVVPIVAKKIANLRQAAPFIMGANVGTTITAFIAATLNSNTASAVSIAIAHFLFNFIGVLLFFPVPVLQKLPMELANGLGRLTLRYRLAGFVFLLLTFFFIPFSLIYFNQNSVQIISLTYEVEKGNTKEYYRINARTNARSQTGEWVRLDGRNEQPNEEPSLIFPVYVKNNSLFVGKDMFLFNKAGFCWDGEDEQGKYKTCIEKVLPEFKLANGLAFDSVFVCNLQYPHAGTTTTHRIYLSAPFKVILRHEIFDRRDSLIQKEEVINFEKK